MRASRQTRRRSRLGLILGALAAAALMAAVARADTVSNTLDTTVDSTFETMSLSLDGPDGSTGLYVIPAGNDGKNGCNLTGSSSVTFAVASSDAGVATVAPAPAPEASAGGNATTVSGNQFTLRRCSSGASDPLAVLNVHPVSAGSADVSISVVANGTGGSFNVAPASFTAVVAPPPNTPPVVELTGPSEATAYAKGSVPTAGCLVSDAEDGLSGSTTAAAAQLGAVSGPYASDGIGLQTASCSYTDGGGLTTSVSATYSIFDPSAPSIGYAVSPTAPDGENGWYTSDVALTWAVSEPESPNSLAVSGCVDLNVTADQTEETYSCAATSAGGPAGPISISIKRDAHAPSVDCGDLPSGWQPDNVVLDCAAFDIGPAGLANADDGSFALQTDVAAGDEVAAAATGSRTVGDNAGNSVTAGPYFFSIDRRAPAVDCEAAPSAWHGADVAIRCTAADGGSGLALAGDEVFYLTTSVPARTETAHASTDSHTVCDAVGNCVTAGPVEGLKVDKKAPTVECEPAAAGWSAADVARACMATDGGAGVSPVGDENFTLETHVPAGAETDDAQTEAKTISDAVGNATTAGPLGGNKVDKKGPTVTVACPSSAIVKGSAATATWSATDSGSGIDGASAGSISLDTSTVGSHAVAAPAGTARDQVGNESTASDPCWYSVVYDWRGFFSPVDNRDAAGNYVLNRAKSGSTIPVKFSLSGNQGLSIFPAGYPMSSQVSCTQSNMDVIEDYSTATVSGLKYDAHAEQYIYNWKTAGAWAGTCRQLVVKLDDGTYHRANFHFVR